MEKALHLAESKPESELVIEESMFLASYIPKSLDELYDLELEMTRFEDDQKGVLMGTLREFLVDKNSATDVSDESGSDEEEGNYGETVQSNGLTDLQSEDEVESDSVTEASSSESDEEEQESDDHERRSKGNKEEEKAKRKEHKKLVKEAKRERRLTKMKKKDKKQKMKSRKR